MEKYTLKEIARPSGGFAMLAVDQREAMRLMFAAAGAATPVADAVLTDFKLNAARVLSPYASAILVDRQFCYPQVVEQKAIAESCAMIVAADQFIPGNGIPVDSVTLDDAVDAQAVRQQGGKALKLLVLWRSDEDSRRAAAISSTVNRRLSRRRKSSVIAEPISIKSRCRFPDAAMPARCLARRRN